MMKAASMSMKEQTEIEEPAPLDKINTKFQSL